MQAEYLSLARRVISNIFKDAFRGLFKGLLKIVVFFALAAYALSLTGCFHSYAHKYRLTVSVRDHDELKSTSNVVGVIESTGPRGGVGPALVCGEAAVITLKNGKTLFALLNGLNREVVPGQFQWRSTPTFLMLHRLGLETEFGWKDDSGIRQLPATRTRIDHLEVYEMPEFVTFRNISDPTTLERVDPEHPELTLGAGVRFDNVALEETGDWISQGVVWPALPWMHRLPWLSLENEYLDRSRDGESVHGYQVVQFKTCNWQYQLQRLIITAGG